MELIPRIVCSSAFVLKRHKLLFARVCVQGYDESLWVVTERRDRAVFFV